MNDSYLVVMLLILEKLQWMVEFLDIYIFCDTIYKPCKIYTNFKFHMLLILKKMGISCSTNELIHAKIVHSHL